MSVFEYRVTDVTHEFRCDRDDDGDVRQYYFHVTLHLKNVQKGGEDTAWFVEVPTNGTADDAPFPEEVSYLYQLRNVFFWGKDSCLMLDNAMFGTLTTARQLFLVDNWMNQILNLLSDSWADLHTNTETLTEAEMAIICHPSFKIDTLGDGTVEDKPYLSVLASTVAYIGLSDTYSSQLLLAKALNTLHQLLSAKQDSKPSKKKR